MSPPPEKTTGTPSFRTLSAVCRAPGQDGGLRERGDCRVPLQPGRQLPLLGAESPPTGGTSLHGNDRGCQPSCCPAAGKETGSAPWGGFCPEWGLGLGSPVLLRSDLPPVGLTWSFLPAGSRSHTSAGHDTGAGGSLGWATS